MWCGVLFVYGVADGPLYRTEALRAVIGQPHARCLVAIDGDGALGVGSGIVYGAAIGLGFAPYVAEQPASLPASRPAWPSAAFCRIRCTALARMIPSRSASYHSCSRVRRSQRASFRECALRVRTPR